MPLALVPGEGAAAIGVLAARQPDLVAVIDGGRAGVSKLAQPGKVQALLVAIQAGEQALGVVRAERQVHGVDILARVDVGKRFQAGDAMGGVDDAPAESIASRHSRKG